MSNSTYILLSNPTMTIGDLKEKIADLPDDMPVGGTDFIGNFIDPDGMHVQKRPYGSWFSVFHDWSGEDE